MKLFSGLIFLLTISQAAFAQPDVPKKKFALYLLAGQSNMAGRGKVEEQDKTTHPRIWMLSKDNTWVLATEPLHFDKPDVIGVGPGFAFAKALAEADTNVVIGLIPSAVGGSPIEVWEPGKYYEPTKSHPYDDAMKRTKIAIQKGELKGILWQQGESDSDSLHSGLYAEKLQALVSRFRKELSMKSLPFVAGTMAEFYVNGHPYAKVVNEAIIKLPEKVKNTSFVSGAGLTEKGDQTHFDSISARELGRRYAEVFKKMYLK
jgi:hypothetical protein